MTRKNLWCVGVLLLTFLSNVLAEQPADIDSAFGYRLGATFDPTGAREINLELNKMMGTREYEIQPSKEYGLFKTYSVTVSPKSNRIWLISAEAKFNEPTICTREMKDLHQVLVGKYGPSLSINHPSVQKKLIFREAY